MPKLELDALRNVALDVVAAIGKHYINDAFGATRPMHIGFVSNYVDTTALILAALPREIATGPMTDLSDVMHDVCEMVDNMLLARPQW